MVTYTKVEIMELIKLQTNVHNMELNINLELRQLLISTLDISVFMGTGGMFEVR